MRKLNSMLVIALLCLGTSCSKSLTEEDSAAKKRSSEFQTSVEGHKYKLVAFYADKAIDYIGNDNEVKSETDLWIYVKDYLKDDEYYYGADGKLAVHQKAIRISTDNSDVINTTYNVAAQGADVAVTYFDYFYKPLVYKLHEFDNAYFTLYVDGPSGSKLYSKFARVE